MALRMGADLPFSPSQSTKPFARRPLSSFARSLPVPPLLLANVNLPGDVTAPSDRREALRVLGARLQQHAAQLECINTAARARIQQVSARLRTLDAVQREVDAAVATIRQRHDSRGAPDGVDKNTLRPCTARRRLNGGGAARAVVDEEETSSLSVAAEGEDEVSSRPLSVSRKRGRQRSVERATASTSQQASEGSLVYSDGNGDSSGSASGLDVPSMPRHWRSAQDTAAIAAPLADRAGASRQCAYAARATWSSEGSALPVLHGTSRRHAL